MAVFLLERKYFFTLYRFKFLLVLLILIDLFYIMQKIFDHEKLRVYQSSIHFIVWLRNILDNVPKSFAVHNQLDRASTSVPLNIAEGNGKSSPKDRCRFFEHVDPLLNVLPD